MKAPLIVACFPPLLGHATQVVSIANELVHRGNTVACFGPLSTGKILNGTALPFHAWEEYLDSQTLARIYLHVRELFAQLSVTTGVLAGESRILDSVASFYSPMFDMFIRAFRDIGPSYLLIERSLLSAMDAAACTGIPYCVEAQFLGGFGKRQRHHPHHGTPFIAPMSFPDRVKNSLWPAAAMTWFVRPALRIATARARSGVPPLSNPFKKRKIIVGSSQHLDRLAEPHDNVSVVGPILTKTRASIAPSLESWLDERQSRGVIYVSFGTLADIKALQVHALIEGLQQTGLDVLWALNQHQQKMLPVEIPSSFRIENFVPQPAVLAHGAVRVFVSHCGLNSILEAAISAKPILGIPIFGDQFYNSARMVELGVGLRLLKEELNGPAMAGRLRELLETADYKVNAHALSEVLQREDGRTAAAREIEKDLNNQVGEEQTMVR